MEMDAATAIELLDAQPRVWDHCLGYINAMTVQCAVELEIADVVHGYGQPISLGELAAALEISPEKAPFLSRLMRMLVHLGYFVEEEGEGRYTVAPLCQFLLKDKPFNARAYIVCMNHPNMVDPWRHMSACFEPAKTTSYQQLVAVVLRRRSR
ncbi:unnamed protein product [Linum trigynum]|uniref:O-methyltransferase dimerisation domain-containing protein n=1 Tax=Linum trigynum TaxID=586398 RepID=A0AAV2C8R3_9ROSI